jgi:hypothetical protein
MDKLGKLSLVILLELPLLLALLFQEFDEFILVVFLGVHLL